MIRGMECFVVCWVENDFMDGRRLVGPFFDQDEAERWIDTQPGAPRKSRASHLFKFRYQVVEPEGADNFAWK